MYNLGPVGGGTPNLEIARMVARETGAAARTRCTCRTTTGPSTTAAMRSTRPRIAALGWSAGWTVPQALAETVAWYRDHEAWWSTLIADAEALYAD